MAFAASIPIENVDAPRFLRFEGAGAPPSGVDMEVYTGVVITNFDVAGDNIVQEEHRSFLPVGPPAQDLSVRAYPENSFADVTAIASLATITGAEDEAVLVGVDFVQSVKLEPQSALPGIGGTNWIPVLRVQLAGLNASILRYTYQVTVLVVKGKGAEIVDLVLRPGSSPA